MKIKLTSWQHGNLQPEAFNLLKHLPDEMLHYADHQLRHPFSIYSLSLQKVFENFEKLLNLHEKIQISSLRTLTDSAQSLGMEELLDVQEALFHSLMQHVDDCYLILKSVHPADSAIKKRFANAWLQKKNSCVYQKFKDGIESYHKILRDVVNKIKHNHGRLRPVMMHSGPRGVSEFRRDSRICLPPREFKVLGYFLEGVNLDGTIGVDRDFHGGDYGNSLNRDLRLHCANVYRIGRHLAKALKSIAKQEGGIVLSSEPFHLGNASLASDRISKVLENISSIPFVFFYNETLKNTPVIDFNSTQKGDKLLVSLPGSQGHLLKGETFISAQFQVDSVALSYRPPYFPKKQPRHRIQIVR